MAQKEKTINILSLTIVKYYATIKNNPPPPHPLSLTPYAIIMTLKERNLNSNFSNKYKAFIDDWSVQFRTSSSTLKLFNHTFR